MYYVELVMNTRDRGVLTLCTPATEYFTKAVSQFEAYKDVAETFVSYQLIFAYELRMGTLPNI